MVKGENLFDSVGQVAETEVSKPQDKVEVAAEVPTDKEPVVKAAEDVSKEVESKFNDAGTWTKESALLEVKRLREENKASRIKYQEQLDSFKAEMEGKISSVKEESTEAFEAKKQLAELQAKEADKKRSMEEKLAHREAAMTEIESKYTNMLNEQQKQMKEMAEKLSSYEVEREAQLSVYKERITQELETLPEKYRKFADSIVRGHSDLREAWTALSEAKMSGMFEEKKVVVSHATPGASEGARTTGEAQLSAKRAQWDKLSSGDKIREGLKQKNLKTSGNLLG